jgi:hypothetical protein
VVVRAVKALMIRCRTCKVPPGYSCRDRNGVAMVRFHKKRIADALKASLRGK